jgi:hypothetical protein
MRHSNFVTTDRAHPAGPQTHMLAILLEGKIDTL